MERDMINGQIIGVFSTDSQLKTEFLRAQGKKHEESPLIIYQRVSGENTYTFLDTDQYPEKISTYGRIASLVDYVFYILPKDGKIDANDGELALLFDSLAIKGIIVDMRNMFEEVQIRRSFMGSIVTNYQFERFTGSASKLFDKPKSDNQNAETLIWIDKAFEVKGVGSVLLGFVLEGSLRIHDKFYAIPLQASVEVRNIQVNDKDYEEVSRGTRVGVSVKGIEMKQLRKVRWLVSYGHRVQEEFNARIMLSELPLAIARASSIGWLWAGSQAAPAKGM
ncbi:MAG: hypothetical protein QXG05_08710 [Nitrososphaerota archaeon]